LPPRDFQSHDGHEDFFSEPPPSPIGCEGQNGTTGNDGEPSELEGRWQCTLELVEDDSIVVASLLRQGRPLSLAEDGVLTVAFSEPHHLWHAGDVRNVALVVDALHEVTGRRTDVTYTSDALIAA
jgi:hypothetical protein